MMGISYWTYQTTHMPKELENTRSYWTHSREDGTSVSWIENVTLIKRGATNTIEEYFVELTLQLPLFIHSHLVWPTGLRGYRVIFYGVAWAMSLNIIWWDGIQSMPLMLMGFGVSKIAFHNQALLGKRLLCFGMEETH